MAMRTVEFQFITGIKRAIFRHPRLRGSWDGDGRCAEIWSETPMREEVGEDGCPVFTAQVLAGPR